MRAAWNNLAHLIASEKHSSILSFDLKTKAAALLSTMLSTHWWGELLLYDTPLSLSHSLSLFPSSLLLSVSCYKKPLAWAQGLYQEITGKCQWYSHKNSGYEVSPQDSPVFVIMCWELWECWRVRGWSAEGYHISTCRYSLLSQACIQSGVQALLTAHHANDQVRDLCSSSILPHLTSHTCIERILKLKV